VQRRPDPVRGIIPSNKHFRILAANSSLVIDESYFVQIKRESCSSPISQCEEPTDLTTTGGREREERERERMERERYYSQLMERYNIDRGSPSRLVNIHLCFPLHLGFSG
jgi:hypothetical protein